MKTPRTSAAFSLQQRFPGQPARNTVALPVPQIPER
jgi:hypothetical protein